MQPQKGTVVRKRLLPRPTHAGFKLLGFRTAVYDTCWTTSPLVQSSRPTSKASDVGRPTSLSMPREQTVSAEAVPVRRLLCPNTVFQVQPCKTSQQRQRRRRPKGRKDVFGAFWVQDFQKWIFWGVPIIRINVCPGSRTKIVCIFFGTMAEVWGSCQASRIVGLIPLGV